MERTLSDGEDGNDSVGLECRCREMKIGMINNHKLSIKDECLLVMMKLRMGLSDIDLVEHFNFSNSTVSETLITWINYLYNSLGSLKIWPTCETIFQTAPRDFNQKYRSNIKDATENIIQVPRFPQNQSEIYSNYKGHTTFKYLIAVDPRGGVMLVSQFYGGSISDKEIVRRSGFRNSQAQATILRDPAWRQQRCQILIDLQRSHHRRVPTKIFCENSFEKHREECFGGKKCTFFAKKLITHSVE